MTWSGFVERVAKLASALRTLGLRDHDRVALLAPNSHRYLESCFATLWAGGVVAPANNRHTAIELVEFLRDCTPRILIIDESFIPMLPQLRNAGGLHEVVVIGNQAASDTHDYERLLASQSPLEDGSGADDDLACLFYTGGSTGKPKGVMLSHRNLWANCAGAISILGMNEETVQLHCGPLFHVGSGSRIYSCTMAGGTHVVLPRFDPATVLEAIDRHRVTVAQFVPTMMNMLLRAPEFSRHDLSSLKHVVYGSAPMPPALLRELMQAWPDVRFVQSYGMTELSPVATSLPPEWHVVEGPRSAKLSSVGRPVFGTEIRIVGPDDKELRRGEVGEIVARGPNVMRGYWNQPELTAQALRGGWLHTGDLGKMDQDGFVYVVDRLKDMIITGGENVYSAEVENALYEHPSVLECAVLGLSDERWGERVHAIVVPKDGAMPAVEDLLAHCRERIAGYKCPRSIDLRTQRLPQTPANKIDKVALRRAASSLGVVP